MKTVSVGKIFFDKLVEECTENIEETRLVLFPIIFTINVGIGTYFAYSHWYLNNYDALVMLDTRTETTIYWIYKWDKSNKLTLKIKAVIFWRDGWYKKFLLKLTKDKQKVV